MDRIFEEIRAEREHQQQKWGDTFDDKNTLNDWVTYIAMYGGQAAKIGNSKEEQRKGLLKVATLVVAALEAFDRNGGFSPRHYDN